MMMAISKEYFDKIYKSIMEGITDIREYPTCSDTWGEYPFHFSDSQIELILDIPSTEKFKSIKGLDAGEYDTYFCTCNFLLSVNKFENFTIDRYLKILKYYVEARKLNLIKPSIQGASPFPEEERCDDMVFNLLVQRRPSDSERDVLEKFIEENLDSFLDYFRYSDRELNGLHYPMEILRVFSKTLQRHFNFSVGFLEKHYEYFNCFDLYYNKRIMSDMACQRLVFGKIKEHTLNSMAMVLTSGKVHPNFKVKEEDILSSIFKYN